MPRRGLPESATMRHDAHYVDVLTAPSGSPVGQLVSIEDLDPNPDQPRQSMGDLSDLMASVAEKGIIEPLIVRPCGRRFQIVAGERRYQAAVQVGLSEVPVVIRDADNSEAIEIAIIENIQRKDLTPFEEADAIQSLGAAFGHTHEELARKLGKSRTAITESLALNTIPESVKELCRLADITSKSLLVQIARQPTEEAMVALVEQFTRSGRLTRAEARAAAASKSRAKRRGQRKAYVFKYAAPSQTCKLQLNFRKSQVDRQEVIAALEEILIHLRDQPDSD